MGSEHQVMWLQDSVKTWNTRAGCIASRTGEVEERGRRGKGSEKLAGTCRSQLLELRFYLHLITHTITDIKKSQRKPHGHPPAKWLHS